MVRIEGLAWDEEAEEHIRRHHVTMDEVEEAVQNVGYAQKSRGYLMILGKTGAGRYLTAVLDDQGDGLWYPVTARPMKESERRLLARRPTARRSR